MEETYQSTEWNGVKVTYPSSWIAKTLSGDVVLVPPELSEQDVRYVPISVILRNTPLLPGMKFGEAVRLLNGMREGYARFKSESAPEAGAGALKAEWSDGVTDMISFFVERSHSFVEVIYGVAFRSHDFSLARLLDIVHIEVLR
jgi:hypothetical protein